MMPGRPYASRLPWKSRNVIWRTRAGARLSLLLAGAICACAVPPESPASRPQDRTGPDPLALWIAVTSRGDMSGSAEQETLVPIARHIDGTWDNAPWAEILYIDGPGPGIEAVRTGEGEWSWPDASGYWGHPGRAADTVGRTPDVIATAVPRSWFLHSPDEQGLPYSTTGLLIVRAHCDHRWAIGIDPDSLPLRAAAGARGPPAIASTRVPAAVLSEEGVPGLEQIRRDLGFADISEGRKGDRSFRWLGIFRFDDGERARPAAAQPADAGAEAQPAGALGDTTLGVLWALYYESAEYIVIEIDGERSRVLTRTSEGGC